MKIFKPNETILIDGILHLDLLRNVCIKRSGNLRTFFANKKNRYIFLKDNARFKNEFKKTGVYTPSVMHYFQIKEQMKNLYNDAADGNDRSYIKSFRDKNISATCPYCLKTHCNQLDHYYDKATYPELSLNLWNLVPSCGNCNFQKMAQKSITRTQRFIHPFFDDFYNVNESYYIQLIINHINGRTEVTFHFSANPNIHNDIRDVLNWHITEMEQETHNRYLFRSDFEYYVHKVRRRKLQDKNLIFDFLQQELSDEMGFSWRGIMLTSLCCHMDNFNKACDLIFDKKYII